MDTSKYTTDDKKFIKDKDDSEQNPSDNFKITWWNLVKSVINNKTSWIIILGMIVLLIGYFSNELITNKIVYDNDGIFRTYKVKKLPDPANKNLKDFVIRGKFPPSYNPEIYTLPEQSPIIPKLDKYGSFTAQVSLPEMYQMIFAKASYNNHTIYYRFYLSSMRQQQIQKSDYDRGLKAIERRFGRNIQIDYEPSKAVDLITQGLIFFFGSIIVALILGINPFKLGLKLGDFKNWVPITALFILVMLPVFYIVAHTDSFKASYPSDYQSRESMQVFWIITIAYLIYFLGWEFIFRGYFLMALKDRIGIVPAILFQMVPFAAMHINKPPLEALSSVFGGIILGILVIRVRSFWPCVIIHWILHASINYFVCTLHYW